MSNLGVEEAIEALEEYLGDDERALDVLSVLSKKVRNQAASLSTLHEKHAKCPGRIGSMMIKSDNVRRTLAAVVRELEKPW